MLTKRKIRHWEAAVRQQAYDNARALAVAIAAGTAWLPPPYDLGIVLVPGEVVWYRCPGTYYWRGTDSWIEQRSTRRGRQMTSRQVNAQYVYCLGTTDWLATNLRLATRAPDGPVISIQWAAICGLAVDLANEVVVLDGAGDYHGELSGPAVAPIGIAAIAACHGACALIEHPALALLRANRSTVGSVAGGRSKFGFRAPERREEAVDCSDSQAASARSLP